MPFQKREKDGMPRRRNCRFCRRKVDVDYKDITGIQACLKRNGEISKRATTGLCRRHQSQLNIAVARAREMALLPYPGGGREAQLRRTETRVTRI